jgi:hypothetical protein
VRPFFFPFPYLVPLHALRSLSVSHLVVGNGGQEAQLFAQEIFEMYRGVRERETLVSLPRPSLFFLLSIPLVLLPCV